MALFISSLSSSLALVIVGLLGAEWWLVSARAMATLTLAYRKSARRRRSLRRLAAPEPGAWSTVVSATSSHTRKHVTHNQEKGNSLACGGLLLLFQTRVQQCVCPQL